MNHDSDYDNLVVVVVLVNEFRVLIILKSFDMSPRITHKYYRHCRESDWKFIDAIMTVSVIVPGVHVGSL